MYFSEGKPFRYEQNNDYQFLQSSNAIEKTEHDEYHLLLLGSG